MRRRYGKEQWRAGAQSVLAVMLAFVFLGAAPLAFATDEIGTSEESTEARGDNAEAPAESEELAGSAFTLGDVTITCTVQEADAAGAGELALGQPVERTYLLTNEGEPAYVRLASALAYESLQQPNELTESDRLAWRPGEDGWWYRAEPLASGETSEVHVLALVPFTDAWVEALSTGTPSSIEESIRVEAVQARNMSVDLSAGRPWGDLKVERPKEDAPAAVREDGR